MLFWYPNNFSILFGFNVKLHLSLMSFIKSDQKTCDMLHWVKRWSRVSSELWHSPHRLVWVSPILKVRLLVPSIRWIILYWNHLNVLSCIVWCANLNMCSQFSFDRLKPNSAFHFEIATISLLVLLFKTL